MELLFVDESGDSKFKGYFGLCVAAVNHYHYKTVKSGFQATLANSSWDESIEFKGSHLFSARKGDVSVPVDERIDIAAQILDLNAADSNARMRFHYACRNDCDDMKRDYLEVLPELVHRALPKAKKGKGKDIVAISCDYRQDISASEIQNAVLPAVIGRGYTLFEEVTTPTSNFHTVGILYADLISYLSARVDTIKNDVELFENIPEDLIENNGKVRKLRSSTELIDRIKRLERHIIQS